MMAVTKSMGNEHFSGVLGGHSTLSFTIYRLTFSINKIVDTTLLIITFFTKVI